MFATKEFETVSEVTGEIVDDFKSDIDSPKAPDDVEDVFLICLPWTAMNILRSLLIVRIATLSIDYCRMVA